MLAGWEVLEQSICHGYEGVIWQERELLEGKKPWTPEDEGSLKRHCRSSGGIEHSEGRMKGGEGEETFLKKSGTNEGKENMRD